jgi:hypothetical protein
MVESDAYSNRSTYVVVDNIEDDNITDSVMQYQHQSDNSSAVKRSSVDRLITFSVYTCLCII